MLVFSIYICFFDLFYSFLYSVTVTDGDSLFVFSFVVIYVLLVYVMFFVFVVSVSGVFISILFSG